MKYEISIIRNDKQVENYIATEYKTINPTGRLGFKIDKEDREITEIKIKEEGKNRFKHYSILYETIIIKELESGRRILTLEKKKFN